MARPSRSPLKCEDRETKMAAMAFLKGGPLQRDAEVESFWSLFSFVVGFPWELVSGKGR